MSDQQIGLFDEPPGPLQRKFSEFHRQNPWVYKRLTALCRDLRKKGFSRYSMRTLICVLRFEWDLKTTGETVVIDGGDEKRIKLNNNHSPYYARMFVGEHPGFRGFFEFRRAEGDR